jgi:hypothetical protein
MVGLVFHYTFLNMWKVDWLDEFYISAAEVGRKQLHFTIKRRKLSPSRRPLLTQLQGRWYLHDADVWVACISLIDALIKWCILLRTRYQDELDNGYNISRLLDCFLGPKPLADECIEMEEDYE